MNEFIKYIMEHPEKIIAAGIGALVAVSIFIVKDIIIYWIRESKKKKKALIDRKLTNIYGPLYSVCVTGQNTIATFMADDNLFEKYTTNSHLLSDELINYLTEYHKLGRGDLRNLTFNAGGDNMKALDISVKFSKQLSKEFKELRKKY